MLMPRGQLRTGMRLHGLGLLIAVGPQGGARAVPALHAQQWVASTWHAAV